MLSATLGSEPRLHRWPCDAGCVSGSRSLVPEPSRGPGGSWLARGCRERPQRAPGPAARPLHAFSFSPRPWPSSSAWDAASKEVAPGARRLLPGGASGTSRPFSAPSTGTWILPRAGPAPATRPLLLPPHQGRRSPERSIVLAGGCWHQEDADVRVMDAVRRKGGGRGAQSREAGCTPRGRVGRARRKAESVPGGLGPSAPPRPGATREVRGARAGSRMLPARSCRAQDRPPSWTAAGLVGSRRPGIPQPVACVRPACGPLSRDMQERPLGRPGVFRSSARPSGVWEDSAA